MSSQTPPIEIGLNAVMVAIYEGNPAALSIPSLQPDIPDALPYGQFNPVTHRTMEVGLRELVEAQTGLRPGYVEQLYTFGDRGRTPVAGSSAPHVVSVGYLALGRLQTNQESANENSKIKWGNWYEYFPWEDWRKGRPSLLDEVIIPALLNWAKDPKNKDVIVNGLDTLSRVRTAFGLEGFDWDDEQVLERYELLYSAGLVWESVADGRADPNSIHGNLGNPMLQDHRRILATAIARLRGKLKYRPVIFELMQDVFTLFDLQQKVESILGRSVHKQNFRRLVEKANLVEPTGASEHSTGGRPAALFRFRHEIFKERPASGLKVGWALSS